MTHRLHGPAGPPKAPRWRKPQPGPEHSPPARRPEALANAEAWESRGVGSSSPATMCFQVTVGDVGAISVNVTDQPASEGGKASQSLALPTFSNRRHGRLHSPATGAPSGCKCGGWGRLAAEQLARRQQARGPGGVQPGRGRDEHGVANKLMLVLSLEN